MGKRKLFWHIKPKNLQPIKPVAAQWIFEDKIVLFFEKLLWCDGMASIIKKFTSSVLATLRFLVLVLVL